MKSLVIMIAATLAAVVLCVFFSHHISATCAELLGDVAAIRAALPSEDFEGIARSLEAFQGRWLALERNWAMLCDHDDLNRVTEAVQRALVLCAQRRADRLELECKEIELALLNIAHKEDVSPQNII